MMRLCPSWSVLFQQIVATRSVEDLILASIVKRLACNAFEPRTSLANRLVHGSSGGDIHEGIYALASCTRSMAVCM
jgi:hypothetical protein